MENEELVFVRTRVALITLPKLIPMGTIGKYNGGVLFDMIGHGLVYMYEGEYEKIETTDHLVARYAAWKMLS